MRSWNIISLVLQKVEVIFSWRPIYIDFSERRICVLSKLNLLVQEEIKVHFSKGIRSSNLLKCAFVARYETISRRVETFIISRRLNYCEVKCISSLGQIYLSSLCQLIEARFACKRMNILWIQIHLFRRLSLFLKG